MTSTKIKTYESYEGLLLQGDCFRLFLIRIRYLIWENVLILDFPILINSMIIYFSIFNVFR